MSRQVVNHDSLQESEGTTSTRKHKYTSNMQEIVTIIAMKNHVWSKYWLEQFKADQNFVCRSTYFYFLGL